MQFKTVDGDVTKLAARGEAQTGRLSDFLVRDTPVAYAFIGPAFFLLLFLVAYPFVLSLWFSLSDARVGETGSFVGLDNFARLLQDRKSTRLNSSHDQISYAVFCLKKKTADESLPVTAVVEPRA